MKSQYLGHIGPDHYATGRENIAHEGGRCYGWSNMEENKSKTTVAILYMYYNNVFTL